MLSVYWELSLCSIWLPYSDTASCVGEVKEWIISKCFKSRMKGAGRANLHKACSVLPIGVVTSAFLCLCVPPLLPPCAEPCAERVSTAFPCKVFRGRKRTKATLSGWLKCLVISGEARSREGAVQGRICSHPHLHLHPHPTLLSHCPAPLEHALGMGVIFAHLQSPGASPVSQDWWEMMERGSVPSSGSHLAPQTSGCLRGVRGHCPFPTLVGMQNS